MTAFLRSDRAGLLNVHCFRSSWVLERSPVTPAAPKDRWKVGTAKCNILDDCPGIVKCKWTSGRVVTDPHDGWLRSGMRVYCPVLWDAPLYVVSALVWFQN
jgi:hypothetical protein